MTTMQARTGRTRPSPAAGRRRGEPRRAPELAPLTLGELRAYRRELQTEESRVSYWRRVLQARLDLSIGDDDRATLGRLRTVLTDHGVSSLRLALQTCEAPGGPPALPDLAALWQTPVGPLVAGEEMRARLGDAERQLSAYRRSLHQRLDAATGELIARYRENPALALSALPVGPVTGSDVA